MQIVLPEDLEKEFRDVVGKEMGAKKGNISLAAQEAIRMWIENQRRKSK